ncbi:MAG: ATP synthase F1 subunit epsilon [Chloroflexi bacterium]|nr:MAG: ATP synthase F1 subunit epsilon [Chloroflexota bacterium]MBL1194445.1 ATP synthase F1 subunit epsilon [Chloroflexota bacterium]NOH11733.1 ATP synthase F1 subunit epsilon [Chloroflexota bacterium]
MTIRCEIVSQDRMVYEDDVDIVVIPGTNGEMGILPNHAPVLSTLQYGIIKVRKGDEEHIFTATGGVVEVQPEIITILADASEDVEDIDIARAEAAKESAQQRLEEGPPPDTDAYMALEAAIRRSNLRLEAARRFRRGARGMPGFATGPSEEDGN